MPNWKMLDQKSKGKLKKMRDGKNARPNKLRNVGSFARGSLQR